MDAEQQGEQQQGSETPFEPTEGPSEEEVIQQAVDALEAAEKDGEGEVRSTDEKPAEEPAEPAEQQSPEEIRLAQRVAEITRRDRVQRADRKQLAADRAAFEKSQKSAQDAESNAKTIRDAFETNPRVALKKHFGLDIVDLLASIEGDEPPANDRASQETTRLQQHIEALEKRIQQREDQEEQDRQRVQYSEAYQGVLSRIHGVVSTDPEAFEAILDRGPGGSEDVFRYLDAWYQRQKEDGQQPAPPDDGDIAEAAKMVEDVYRKQEYEDIKAQAGKKRFAGRLSFGDAPNIATEELAKIPAASQPKPTLTNSLHGTPPQKRVLLTDDERMAAAMDIPVPTFEE